jgi:uncharacterized protein with PIN domain
MFCGLLHVAPKSKSKMECLYPYAQARKRRRSRKKDKGHLKRGPEVDHAAGRLLTAVAAVCEIDLEAVAAERQEKCAAVVQEYGRGVADGNVVCAGRF